MREKIRQSAKEYDEWMKALREKHGIDRMLERDIMLERDRMNNE